MTKAALRLEHEECDRQPDGCLRLAYKVLHLRRRGCPVCAQLRSRKRAK